MKREVRIHAAWRALLLAVSCAVCLSSSAPSAAAERLAFGFERFPAQLSVTTKEGPAGIFAAVLTGRALTARREPKVPGDAEFELALAESLDVSPDLKRWSFRVRAGAVFTNGNPVTTSDVRFSLERCAVRKELEAIEAGPGVVTFVFGAAAVSDAETIKGFPVRLADCPVWEEASAEVFGELLGMGTTFVGSGAYAATRAEPGKRTVFTRMEGDALPESVELRGVAAPAQGLQLLRSGGLDLYATEDPETLERAEKDETLLRRRCSNYSVIVRRGLRFTCASLPAGRAYSSSAFGYEE